MALTLIKFERYSSGGTLSPVFVNPAVVCAVHQVTVGKKALYTVIKLIDGLHYELKDETLIVCDTLTKGLYRA